MPSISNFYEYTATRNAKLQVLVDLLSGGFLKVYTGAQPAMDAAASGTLLATLPLANPCGTVSNGILTFAAITSSVAVDSGTAGWAALEGSDNTIVATGTCGLSAQTPDFVLNTVTITSGNTVACSAGTLTAPA